MRTDGAAELMARVKGVITKPSTRDQQQRIGPSSVGDTCERCLGLELLAKDGHVSRTPQFNLSAWVGTAIHHYLDHLVAQEQWPGVRRESKVRVGTIKGYGPLSGSADLIGQRERAVVDYKSSSVRTIRQMRAIGHPPLIKEVQLDCYALGVEETYNWEVESVGNLFIPRDSMDPNEIWAYSRPFNRKRAKRAMKRASALYALLKDTPGKVELLTSEKGCYRCNPYKRDVSFADG